MDWYLDRILRPEILALSIPVLAVLLWGLRSIVLALRGQPDLEDFENWKQELVNLRARVDLLEELTRAKGPDAR